MNKTVSAILVVLSAVVIIFFQNCGQVNLLNPTVSESVAPPPEPLPVPTPEITPAATPADTSQPYANRIISQGTGAENFFCGNPISSSCISPTDGTRRPHIGSDSVPAAVTAACGADVFYKEMPWIDATSAIGQFGVVLNSVGNDQVTVFHTVVPYDEAILTNTLNFTITEFAAGSPSVNDRQMALSQVPCVFNAPPAGGSEGSLYIAGIHAPNLPPPSLTNINHAYHRGDHIYFSVSANKNPNYICGVDMTCAVLLQMKYMNLR